MVMVPGCKLLTLPGQDLIHERVWGIGESKFSGVFEADW
jgi:hypothetical protein